MKVWSHVTLGRIDPGDIDKVSKDYEVGTGVDSRNPSITGGVGESRLDIER